jgi:hypothetical protein
LLQSQGYGLLALDKRAAQVVLTRQLRRYADRT